MVATKPELWSAMVETPIWSGARAVEAIPSKLRHGPGIRKTTARPATTRVLTQRGRRRRGASLIISDTTVVRSADPRVPFAELLARSTPFPCRERHNRVDLQQDAPASSFCV